MAFASAFVAPAMAGFFSSGGTVAISAFQNAIITGTEFAIGGFAGGFAGSLAGGGSISDAFKAGGIGAGIGFVTGAAAGYSYAKGWQDVMHGYDVRAENVRIFSNQISQGNIAGANRTLGIDTTLQQKLLGIKPGGEGMFMEMQRNNVGIYLRGSNAEGAAYMAKTRQLDGSRWVTKPYAIDKLTGNNLKLPFPSNPLWLFKF